MAFYLALDLGGTKTEYVLADETRELARVRGGTIKRMRTDANTATQNLDKALAELTSITGVSMRSVTRSCVGAAGITVALVTDWIRKAFAKRVGGSLVLVGDVEIALDAAFFGGPGVLVMAGTGSNVAGRFLSGNLTTAGGWGPALADQGSGNRIGHQALRDTFFAIDEGRTTTLLPTILELWQLPDLDSLIGYANQIPAPDFTRLAPLVVRCAAEGDAVAQNVLQREAEELAHLAHLVIERLQRDASEGRPGWVPDLAFTGSILEHVAPIRDGIVQALQRRYPSLKVLPGTVDPILGALWRARIGELLKAGGA
ncbi:BadF/BadG/BcrA/BcrD ATPase family protein [Tunturiibacter empetritectus]|uniref:N-acetylglucosamine kinase-like BadF-type ATPase n=1 Tax=Tunturiibacter lichenicola TaxID=2051959 RepID=A0A852VEA7_9BACT|nr:BadF/BadG/BcrA/BcrD ATPase family protein [Edaphobacter lichenicola]NYF90010.1 N-acetylglucosamine kinase-like BadF-type ATPase [Edaphobacter lichenicola]